MQWYSRSWWLYFLLLTKLNTNVLGAIDVQDVEPFRAGMTVHLSWTCTGSTGSVRLVLCKGGPCAYNGGSADPYYVDNLLLFGYCDHRAVYEWPSNPDLASGDDYYFCAQDYSSSSVRGCTQTTISAGEIDITADGPFHAGMAVRLNWTCTGPDSVRLVLCKGGPCAYSGGSADPYYVENLLSPGYCDHRAVYEWPSNHDLASGDDYYFCAQDYSASSVRGCTQTTISAGEIRVDSGGVFQAGESVQLSWSCVGPSAVRIALCQGGHCRYNGGSSDQHFVETLLSSGYCDHRATYTWRSSSDFVADNFYFCVHDLEAASVHGCALVNSTDNTTYLGSGGIPCMAGEVDMYGTEVFTPPLPLGGETTIACPHGYIGHIYLRCFEGSTYVVEEQTTCRSTCAITTTQAGPGRRLEADVFSTLQSCEELDHGNYLTVDCPSGYRGVASVWCNNGNLQTDAAETCSSLGTSTAVSTTSRTASSALTASSASSQIRQTTGATASSATASTSGAASTQDGTSASTASSASSQMGQTTTAIASSATASTSRARATTQTVASSVSSQIASETASSALSSTTRPSTTTLEEGTTTSSPMSQSSTETASLATVSTSRAQSVPLAVDEGTAEDGAEFEMLYVVVSCASICIVVVCCVCVCTVRSLRNSRPTANPKLPDAKVHPEPTPAPNPEPTPTPKPAWVPEIPVAGGCPPYWSGQNPLAQSWRLEVIRPDDPTCQTLSRLLYVADPSQLAVGRDAHEYWRDYNRLDFYAAWRVEYPDLRVKYAAECSAIRSKVEQMRRQGCTEEPFDCKLPVGRDLPGGCAADINEFFLLTGTKPEAVCPILNEGLNSRVSSLSGLMGPGIYFADEAAKMDQYTCPDSTYEQEGLEDLHARLFRAGFGVRHPEEDLFYCLVARVCLGWAAKTKDAATCVGSENPVYHSSEKRELAAVPNSNPPVRYHSVILEPGERVKRHRELVIFSNQQCYIEYVIAYKRTQDGK